MNLQHSDDAGFTALIYPMQHRNKTPSGYLTFDKKSGWIGWRSPKQLPDEITMLCWLPAELRGDKIASNGGVFTVASLLTHQLTIIDFNPMLNSLCNKGLIV
jgi:hypothetical protein